MKQSKVSVVIVTYNSIGYIEECLRSLKEITYKSVELIIIDNNSSDKTAEAVKKVIKNWPYDVSLIENKNNVGYATANNYGAHISTGEFLFVLNPDAQVTPSFLEPLVEELKKHRKIAAVQPTVYLLNKHLKNKLNLTGKVTHFLGFDWLKDYLSQEVPPQQEITSFSGSGVLLRKQTFVQLGGFDDHYFMYFEDTDLSWRMRLAGYKIMYVPESVLYHDYKYSPDEKHQTFNQKFYYFERNRLLTVLKNYSLKSLIVLLPAMLFLEPALVVYSLSKGLIKEKLNGYTSIITNLSYLQQARENTQKLRIVSDGELTKSFVSRITFVKFDHIIVRTVLNPLLAFYWNLAGRLL